VIDTLLAPVPLVPEIGLYQAAEEAGLWDSTGGGYHSDQPPPFWAFAWPGGIALARHLLDHPQAVRGRRVVDLASGSGVVAIAAFLAGALVVRAVDVDPLAVAAIGLNAAANSAQVEPVLGGANESVIVDAEVILVGDGFYSAPVAAEMTRLLAGASRRGAQALVGDPGRGFLPRRLFVQLAEYEVPVRPALEDVPVKPTIVWQLQELGRDRASSYSPW
jgi:predicted nicotinamide N-methyase